MRTKNKVIILTGPCGVGKTTVANILSKKMDIELISGDGIKQHLFPEIGNITEHPKKLKIVKNTILKSSKSHFSNDKSVLIDYVVVGKEYIASFQNLFRKNLVIKVLLPNRNIIYERDRNRDCWTSGRKIIDHLYDNYLNLIDIIGKENYLDTENETPEDTANKILNSINS